MKNNYIVISLGGSIILPDQLDISFIKKFISLINNYVKKGHKFIIITGGGKICRDYNYSLEQIVNPKDEDLDWMGIAVTRLNAEFIRIAFGVLAYEKVLLDPEVIPNTDKPIIIGGGWKPGNSSDLAAVRVAKEVKALKLVNLSNIDFAYNKDPKIFPDAKKIIKTSWKEFRKILPEGWTPGVNSPFDPIAAKEAQGLGLELVIMNGRNIENLKSYLDGKDFLGTTVK